ncbi:glycosyltransferase [Planomonospora parontospora]|uniref:glycosyltransferase n=1 Tax=Planomonospora parontospora TaxID=58119 RepID=UPI0016715ACF|nr:glycosyltransferase [Planomonospora parontospora]GGL54757.1 glycosyl transferase [Planomonospora parontospora subsp. antibiotica]GII19751.1 glycosyl transferase [Planomonospora parontospora subsp. antibiotica]
MRIAVLAFGSRGDTQPCVALGAGLAARGHRVTVVAAGRYGGLVEEAGLVPSPLGVDPQGIVESEEGQAWLRSGPAGFVRGFRRVVEPLAERLVAEVDAACSGADLVLAPALGGIGHHLSERYGMPYALLHFQPSEPTRAFPNPLVPLRTLGPWGNRGSYALVEGLSGLLLGRMTDRLRARVLGLGPLRGGVFRRARADRVPVLCGVSPSVVARPADWPEHVHLTGYWFAGRRWTPPPELVAFLDAGPPPVYAGFGSMAPADPAATARAVVAGLRAAGMRGVLQGLPYGGADDMLVIGEADHAWLFPRTAAVVHHGGAGTTAAGLRAGVPSVVCPFFSDQPFWGARVALLGAGPAPLPVRRLTAAALAGRVAAAVRDPGIRSAAARLGERLRAEDGVARACAALGV